MNESEKEEMTAAELLKTETEENQTRKILLIIKECETLEQAIKRVEELLKN